MIKDVHYPMDEPNIAHVESLAQGNVRLDFFEPV